jgi:gamma-glutamyl:cysteine ligase YbdK (ATP-grasp superfamily)
MGREIERERFGRADFERFSERLGECLAALGELLERPGFGEGPATIGAELEMALVDAAGRPAGENAAVHEALGCDDDVALEVGRFCIESATAPVPLPGRPFTALSHQLTASVDRIVGAAAEHDSRIAMIGTLPTLTMGDLGPGSLTESPRYRALSAALEPLKPDRRLIIDGPEALDVELPGIVAEAANAAFQIHVRVVPADFARTFNAAQLATGPALAASANSPTFLGKLLWDETRVPIFHQAIDGHQGGEEVWRPSRVAFGHGWVRRGILELLQETVALHEVVLPLTEGEDPLAVVRAGHVPELAELRLHHGTTWRWNRAVYDPREGGHLRIELRALPAGPSVIDMAANAAFLIGATLGLADEEWMLPAMPFALARRNFYRAARDGLAAELLWPSPTPPSPRPMPASEAVERLLPTARRGLVGAGVEADEADALLGVMAERVAAEVTGSIWQRTALAAYEERMMRGTALAATLDAYIEAQFSGLPVHRWPTPSRPGSRAAAGSVV